MRQDVQLAAFSSFKLHAPPPCSSLTTDHIVSGKRPISLIGLLFRIFLVAFLILNISWVGLDAASRDQVPGTGQLYTPLRFLGFVSTEREGGNPDPWGGNDTQG